jgi:hypothetical protein
MRKTALYCFCLIVVLTSLGEAETKPTNLATNTSVCEVVSTPEWFNGKVVSLRATVLAGFEVFAIKAPEEDCGRMWLEYAERDSQASSSVAAPRRNNHSMKLVEDTNFKHFQELLRAEMHPKRNFVMCMSCNRYQVSATMVGRIDYAGDHGGFGHMGFYKLQFELVSVSDVMAKDLSGEYDASEFSPDPVRLPTGYIEGQLIAPNGKRYEDASITALRADSGNEFNRSGNDVETDKQGQFKISVPPGQYVVGVSDGDPASVSFPFRPTYAPSAHTPTSAQVFTVNDGEHVHTDIYLNKLLTPRSVPVLVLWPDGRPVADADVWLTEATGNPLLVVGTSVRQTKADGTFVLQGVSETDYVVHAKIYVGSDRFCAPNFPIQSNDRAQLTKLVLVRKGSECDN